MIKEKTIYIMTEPRTILEVTINERESKWAAYAGTLRYHDTKATGPDRRDGTPNSEADHMLGAIGEFAASLALEIPWRGPSAFRAEDLMGRIEVRTRRKFEWDLPIKPGDSDDLTMVLVTATKDPLVWWVVGWIPSIEGKKKMFWANPANNGWAYYVDKLFLYPIKDLKERRLNDRERIS